ncbi:MAG TPA: class I SAM-dependent methyltransferase [Planctomycetota bacterium]
MAHCPHAELLEEAARHVPYGAAVLDAGCGLGQFLDHLPADVEPYLGLDVRDEMIDACRRRFPGRPGAAFEKADLATADLGVGRFDVVAFLNTLEEPGLDEVGLLRQARAALRPGGRVLLAGASSPARFARIEEVVIARRRDDRRFAGAEAALGALLEANRRRLDQPRSDWSVEGKVALLAHLGYGRIHGVTNRLYGGAAYLVAAGL